MDFFFNAFILLRSEKFILVSVLELLYSASWIVTDALAFLWLAKGTSYLSASRTCSDTATVLYQLNDNPNDTCSGGHNGTESNITYATGNFGKAAVFLGNSSPSKITIADSSFLPQGANARSISCWINSNLDGNPVGVLGYGTASTSQAFFIYLNGSAKLGIYAYYDNTDGTISVTANAWTHVVATYDGTDCKLYVNNVLDFTAAKTLNTGSGEFRMGGVNWNNSSEFFNGEIDQVRIFPTALTTDQVNALYTETAP